MPYSMKKLNRKSCRKWTIYNQKTRRVFAKCTSKTRAKKQLNLLRAIHYNKDFVPNRNRK